MAPLRLRFAPSPTGHLHIGGARTALFNWLLARQQKGSFVLRIEDTDRERSTDEYIEGILDGMRWLGLDWDEGPFRQVERSEIYQEHIEKLLQEGKAYRCYCTKEELEERRQAMQKEGVKPKYDGRCREADQSQEKEHCIRFLSTDEGQTTITDDIRGAVAFENKELDDLIIRRSDGTPTYNLCVVVDDVKMTINYVIRGDDHLNNTPRQAQLYQAFDYPLPQFAHLPLILGTDKKRLSKRHGATSVLAYREIGYLPEALLNYLARLGWSHGDQEIFSVDEMIEHFSMKNVGKSSGVFNPEKLLWLNGQHLQNLSDTDLSDRLTPQLQKAGYDLSDQNYIEQAIGSVKEKAKVIPDLIEDLQFYFVDLPNYDPKAAEKFLTPEAKEHLASLAELLTNLESFDEESLKKAVTNYLESKELKLKVIAQPLRVALTGRSVSPGIYEIMVILGKERVLRRLNNISGS